MRDMRTIGAAALLAALASGTLGCQRHAEESRVRAVEARIDGITCPTCVPPLTAALKRQYAASAVEVSDDKDTATVHFAEKDEFSAADFRSAVERVRMHVLSVRMQACGRIESADGGKWLTAGPSRFRVQSDGDVPLNTPVCADGTLDGASEPATFHVSSVAVQGTPGS
jgi:copper chaperone CopZ